MTTHDRDDELRIEREPVLRHEQVLHHALERQLRPRLRNVVADDRRGHRPQRHDTILVPLSSAHGQRLAVGIKVGELKRTQFGIAHASRVEDLEDRTIAQTKRR